MHSSPLPTRYDDVRPDARRLLYLFAIVVLMLIPAQTIVAAARVNTRQQKDEAGASRSEARGQSIVRGRVIYEDTRRPVRRVGVMLYDPAAKGRRINLMSWTDGRGEFQIKNVPAGKYFIQIEAPGIIRSGPFDSEEAQKEIATVTVDGTSKAEVVVRVKRGAAISGKVSYADGDPVLNASIILLRKKEGRWMPVFIGGRTNDHDTDERGIYRISGLAPGEYLIGAAEEKMGIELTAQDDPEGGNVLNRALISTTYYDGATSTSAATPLQIMAGDEKTDINITLADRPVHSISGVVTLKTDNRPVSRARISLKRKDEEPDSVNYYQDPVVNSDEQGRFTVDEVLDGNYTLTVTPPQPLQQRYGYGQTTAPAPAHTDATRKFAVKQLEISVTGADLMNLLIEVSSGGRISGVMTMDGGKPLPPNTFVALEPSSGERRDHLSAPVQPDGSFTLEGVTSGSYYLRTFVQQTNKFYTKSVMHGRSDITREPLTVKDGEEISNVRMVISADVAQLSGRVLASDGKSPESGVGVMFISADPLEQKTMSRRMFGLTNAEGIFRVSGAPGEYLALIVRPGEDYYQLRGDALKLRAATAQRVTLQPGENTRLELVAPSAKSP